MKIPLDFDISKKMETEWVQFEMIIHDRGSKYSVTAAEVHGREDIKEILKRLKTKKKYAKATHNTWASRISHQGAIWETKNDDGETGAGMTILNILRKQDHTNIIVIVTRWYGGIKLMGDRFKHVQDATIYVLKNMP